MKKNKIAVIGCGLGGAAITALLQKNGYSVKAYEQSSEFTQTGAGIHLTPNMLMALKGIEVEHLLSDISCAPDSYTSRDGFTSEIIFNLPLSNAKELYGGQYLTIQRNSFHKILLSAIQPDTIKYGKRLVRIEENDERVQLYFSDGTTDDADLLIGADGLSSRVRQHLCGEQPPHFSGQVAFRAVVPVKNLVSPPIDEYAKWWAPNHFIVAYYLNHSKDQFYFIAGLPAQHWPEGTSSLPGTREELLDNFSLFHPKIKGILEASIETRKWPLYERQPNPLWHNGRIVMLGDACHPMKPHMAQGAAMAVEDGVVLFRSLEKCLSGDREKAFALYAKNRIERTSEIQRISSNDNWLQKFTDPGWVYSYDAWKVDLF